MANSWFSNNATPIIPRNNLIQNQFGGNIGGPIKRDKVFFFFNSATRGSSAAELVQRTVPLDSLRNGNINYCTNASTECSTQNTLICRAGARPLTRQGSVKTRTGSAIHRSASRTRTTMYAATASTRAAINFNAPNNDYATNYVGRIDYNHQRQR